MRRWILWLFPLGQLLLAAALAFAQLNPIPADPLGQRGAANLCPNAVTGAWEPCSAANPLQTTVVGGGGGNVNVTEWGSAATTLGAKTTAASVPVTLPTDAANVPVAVQGTSDVNVIQWGSVNTTLGQKPMATSVPVTIASDQTPVPVNQSSTVALEAQGVNWFRATGFTGSDQDVTFTSDYTAVGAVTNGTSRLSFDRGRTWSAGGALSNMGSVTGIASYGGYVIVTADSAGGGPTVSVWRSVNGGLTWTRTDIGSGSTGTSCAPGIASTGTAVLHSTDGDWRSTNYGATWTRMNTTNRCNAAFAMNGNTLSLGANVWLSTVMSGEVLRSTDDGQTWTSVLAFGTTSARITALTSSIILAIGDASAGLQKSTDGGQTWALNYTFPSSLKAVQAVTSTIAMIWEANHIWRTLDAGGTWSIANTTFFTTGCGTTGCTIPTTVNSLGDIVLAQNQGGGQEQIAYSPFLLPWEQILVSANDLPFGTSTNPIRNDPTGTTPQPVSGTVTANQGAGANGTVAWPVAPVQGGTLFNSQTTGAADTAVTVTIAAAASTRAHVYNVHGFCSAGTSTLTVTDGGTTIWGTTAGEVGTSRFEKRWEPGLTGATNSQVVITLATCGAGNTGTLHVQADRF